MKAPLLMLFAVITLNVYLFVSAPPPLPEDEAVHSTETLPIAQVFELLNAENAAARNLYTQDVVGPGLLAGLSFSEDWQRNDVQAGPLPALLLRETARNLERLPLGLSLFLGSDFPIKSANLFAGTQAEAFARMREHGSPETFYAPEIERHTAMFPDLASAAPCVTCHNEHPHSPKKDWKRGDMMGATTWTYAKDRMTLREAAGALEGLRASIRQAYAAYLAKVETWPEGPTIGDCWPRQGYCLPSEAVFMELLERKTAARTLAKLFENKG